MGYKTLEEMPNDMRDLEENMGNEDNTRWESLLHKVISCVAFRQSVGGSVGKWLKTNRLHWSDNLSCFVEFQSILGYFSSPFLIMFPYKIFLGLNFATKLNHSEI